MLNNDDFLKQKIKRKMEEVDFPFSEEHWEGMRHMLTNKPISKFTQFKKRFHFSKSAWVVSMIVILSGTLYFAIDKNVIQPRENKGEVSINKFSHNGNSILKEQKTNPEINKNQKLKYSNNAFYLSSLKASLGKENKRNGMNTKLISVPVDNVTLVQSNQSDQSIYSGLLSKDDQKINASTDIEVTNVITTSQNQIVMKDSLTDLLELENMPKLISKSNKEIVLDSTFSPTLFNDSLTNGNTLFFKNDSPSTSSTRKFSVGLLLGANIKSGYSLIGNNNWNNCYTPLVGGFFKWHLTNNWNLEAEIQLKELRQQELSYSFYGFEEYTVKIDRLGFLEIPILAEKTIGKHHSILAGIKLDWLITSNQSCYDDYGFAGSIKQVKQIDSFLRFGYGITFGYEYLFFKRFSLGMKYNLGITDFTNDDIFNNSYKDYNSDFQLYLKCKIY